MNRWIFIFCFSIHSIGGWCQSEVHNVEYAIQLFREFQNDKAVSLASSLIIDDSISDYDKSRAHRLLYDIFSYSEKEKASLHLKESIDLLESDFKQEHRLDLIFNLQDFIIHVYPDSLETAVYPKLQSLFKLYDEPIDQDKFSIRSMSDFFFSLNRMIGYYGITPEIEKLVNDFTQNSLHLDSGLKGQIFYDLAEYYRYKDTLSTIGYYYKVKGFWKDLKDDRQRNALARIDLSLLEIDRKKNKRGYNIVDLDILSEALSNLLNIETPMIGDSFLIVDVLEEKFMVYSDFNNSKKYIDSVIITLQSLINFFPSTYKDFGYYIKLIDYTSALMSTTLLNQDFDKVKVYAEKGIALCEELENSSIFITDQEKSILEAKKAVFIANVDEIRGLSIMDDFDDKINIRDQVVFLQNQTNTNLNLGLNQEAQKGYIRIISLLESLESKTVIDSIGLFAAAKGASFISPADKRIYYGDLALKYYPVQATIVSEEVIQGKCQLLLKMADNYLKIRGNQDMFYKLIDEVLIISKDHNLLNFKCEAYINLAYHFNSIRNFEKQHEYLDKVELIFKKNEDLKYDFYDDYNMCQSLYFIVTGGHKSLYQFTRNIKGYYDSAGYKNKSHEVMTLLSIGSLYANFVNLDTAIYYIEESEKNLNSRVKSYDMYRFYTLAGKGVAYENFGQFSKAKINFERALDFLYAKKDVFISHDNQYNVLVHLYCLNVRYFSPNEQELDLLEQRIETLESSFDVTQTESSMNNYLLYYSFWAERNRKKDINSTLDKMEEILSWVELDLKPRIESWQNNTSYRLAILINAYLNVKSYSPSINYESIKERFKWVDDFILTKLPDEDKINESRKLYHYFMGLIASLNQKEIESLNHLQLAMDIPYERIGYQNELTYLYYSKLFDNAISNGNERQALDAIHEVEQLILNAEPSDFNYYYNLQNKLSVLARFYIVKKVDPPSFFYRKIIESSDINGYQEQIDNHKIKAITYLQQNPNASGGSTDSRYFLNFDVEENMKSPVSVPVKDLLPERSALVFIFKSIQNISSRYIGVVMKKSGENVLLDLGNGSVLDNLSEQKKFLNNYNQLYNTYWSKIDAHLEDVENLVLVVNGVYQKINPMVLQDNKGIFLVDKYEIDIISSILDLYFKGFEVSIDTKEISLVGNPSFTIDSNSIMDNSGKDFIALNRGGSAKKSWITLPGTGSEVSEIKEAFNNYDYVVDLVTGNNASEDHVRSISNPEILHLATHGFVNPSEKIYSNGLVFSGANNTQEWDPSDTDDGYLMAEDILKMNLAGTKLVTLSACETGLFNSDALDFKRAFFMAGAKHVLVSLWKIDDKATRDLMSRFYSSLAQTNRIRLSFQDTQDYMKEKYKNPYYWGSFILISTSLNTQLN